MSATSDEIEASLKVIMCRQITWSALEDLEREFLNDGTERDPTEVRDGLRAMILGMRDENASLRAKVVTAANSAYEKCAELVGVYCLKRPESEREELTWLASDMLYRRRGAR